MTTSEPPPVPVPRSAESAPGTGTPRQPAAWLQQAESGSPPAGPPRQGRPTGWRLAVAAMIMSLLLAPAAAELAAANPDEADHEGAGLLVWALVAGVGFLVFLAVVYLVCYVASTAWHDAVEVRWPSRPSGRARHPAPSPGADEVPAPALVATDATPAESSPWVGWPDPQT